MLNTEDFIKRLENLMEYYSFNASSFADKIGVQRSGISHLLSGRNKPSLDFVLKISEEFPDVDLYWLLNGEGSFLKKKPAPALISGTIIEKKSDVDTEKIQEKKITSDLSPFDSNNEIYKIVIFYNDGSFKDFYPNS